MVDNILIGVKYPANFTSFALGHTLHADIGETRRGHTGVYVNYESGEWNYRQFVVWLRRHIPEYALTPSEIKELGNPLRSAELLMNSAKLIHDRDSSTEKKGELGEIILHGLIRDIYSTSPLVSKLYYKTHPADNVKGFDCVHVIFDNELNEISSLWLGEAKFHKSVSGAIGSAFSSISGFMEAKKMQTEFLTVRNHLDDEHIATSQAEKLLSEYTSLDEIKAKLCVPVLIAYDSNAVQAHSSITPTFLKELEEELQSNIDTFISRFATDELAEIDLHVFFFPVKSKDKTQDIFDDLISGLQGPKDIY